MRKCVHSDSNKKIAMIFIEPTPYILDLLEKGFAAYSEKLEIFFLDENVTQHWDIQSRVFSFQVIQSKRQLFRLLSDIFFKKKYKLIHLAGWDRWFTLFLIFTSRLFRVPVVVETDTPLNSNIPKWKKIVKKIFYPFLFKFPVFFLPGGLRQAKYLNYYGVKNKKIIHAQMTVDIEGIKEYVSRLDGSARDRLRKENGCQSDDIIFLFVGRLLDWKGIRELLTAFQLLEDPRAKLWIVGDGALAEEVQQAEKINSQITYFNRVSGDSLWRIYYAADVFVLASYWEPWGLVINEAMAVGKALIVSETLGCLEDLISNAEVGLIIQPKGIHELRDAMCFMLKYPQKITEMKKNALVRIADWTLQNEANNIMVAWKKFL